MVERYKNMGHARKVRSIGLSVSPWKEKALQTLRSKSRWQQFRNSVALEPGLADNFWALAGTTIVFHT